KGQTKLSAKHVITPACICLPGRGDGARTMNVLLLGYLAGLVPSAIALAWLVWCKSTKRHLARRTAI
ncbi:MAG: hypothetical protein WBV76_11190, partial [Pseudolabrys sp.]